MDSITLIGLGLTSLVVVPFLIFAYYVVREERKAEHSANKLPTRTIEMPVKLVMNFYD